MSSDPPIDEPMSSENPIKQLAQTSSATQDQTSLPADIRHQVEQEQALADAQKRLKELEADNERLQREKKEVEESRDGSVSTNNQLRTQLSQLQSTQHGSSAELSVIQLRIDSVESEKRELLEEVERLQQRSTRSTQELYALRTQRTEASSKIAHLDVEVSELKMAAESSKFNENRATQALQAARAEILNLSKGTAEVEERFGRYRAEKQSELSELQVQHDNITARLTSSESSHHALQRSYNDVSQRLAEAHANIARLTSSAAEKKTSSSLEMNRLMDENRVLEKRGEDARQAVIEREAELERITDAYAEKEKQWEEKVKKEERTRKEVEKRAEDLKVVVDRLAMASGEGSGLSPAAALASGAKAGGKTYTQFYTDFTLMEAKLRASENEVSRLTQILDEISADLAEKQPLLDEQQAERDAAMERATALAGQLSTVMATRDAHENTIKSLQASSSHHEEEVIALRSSTDDLNRQVQGLLRQLAIRDDPSLANAPIDGPAPAQGDLITDHLLEFRSIRGLQEQNHKLLKMTRGLMAKLDAQEINRATSDTDDLDTASTLEQATETINRLHAQLLEAQKKINEAVKERDFFSKLLAKGEGLKWSPSGHADGDSPHQQTVLSLQTEVDSIKSKAEEEIKEIRNQLRAKSEAAGVAEVERAKADAKATLLEEQHRILTDSNSLQKQEYNNLDQQYRQLQGVVNQAQNERKSALEQIASKQAEVDRLRTDAANLRAEKEQWQSNEYRLQTDFRSVQNERAKLQQLIDNLNSVSAESEKSRSEERQRMEKRVEEVQRESTALRTQLEQARDATAAAEKRAQEIDSRVAAATTSLRAEKDAADSLATSRQAQITTLTADLEKSKKDVEAKHSIGLRWKGRADTLTTEAKAQKESLAESEKLVSELKAKVDDLTKELEASKGKIAELEKEKKAVAPAPTAGAVADDAEVTSLRAEKEFLQQQLEKAKQELEAAKSASPTSAPAAASEATPSSNPLSDAERSELEKKIKVLEDDQKAQNERYAENVTKVNVVNKSLANARNAAAARVKELESEKAAVDSRIVELEKEVADLKSRLESGSTGTATAQPDQAVIDEAVRTAVAKRETELQAAQANTPDQAAIQAAVSAKEAELNASFETRLAELKATPTSAGEGDGDAKLKAEVEDLTKKLKAAERLVKTAEISRKTLERTKETLETKLAALEGKPAPAPTPAATATATVKATPTGPAGTATTPGAPAAATVVTTPAGPSTGTGTGTGAIRGTARGRGGRGAITRGAAGAARGGAAKNPVLNAVNATLSQTTTTPTSPQSQSLKRPAPEDGEIQDTNTTITTPANQDKEKPAESIIGRIQGAAQAQAGTGPGTRALKRPRGGAAGRGGAAAGARRPSGPGPGAGGAGAGGGGGAGTGST